MLSKSFKKKIIVGTAQFGFDYGVTNTQGKTNKKEIKKILRILKQNHIKFLDIADDYNSLNVLSSLGIKNFKVIYKIKNFKNIKNIELKIKNLRKKIGQKKIYCIMLHDINELIGKEGIKIMDDLHYLKKNYLIQKIGVSTYGLQGIKKAYEKFDFDLIQTTFNPFDRRILNNNILKNLKKRNIKIHIRSIFLQGLLLESNLSKLPKKIQKYKFAFKNWINLINKKKIRKLEACLSFANSKNFDNILIGINNANQLKEIINSKLKKITLSKKISMKNNFLLNPYNWS